MVIHYEHCLLLVDFKTDGMELKQVLFENSTLWRNENFAIIVLNRPILCVTLISYWAVASLFNKQSTLPCHVRNDMLFKVFTLNSNVDRAGIFFESWSYMLKGNLKITAHSDSVLILNFSKSTSKYGSLLLRLGAAGLTPTNKPSSGVVKYPVRNVVNAALSTSE